MLFTSKIFALLAILLFVYYNGAMISRYGLPASMCSTRDILEKHNPKFASAPNVIDIVLAVLLAPISVILSMGTGMVINYIFAFIALVIILSVIFEGATIGCKNHTLAHIHAKVGEISELLMYIWSFSIGIVYGTIFAPIIAYIISSALEQYTKKMCIYIRALFWREMKAYITLFLTIIMTMIIIL